MYFEDSILSSSLSASASEAATYGGRSPAARRARDGAEVRLREGLPADALPGGAAARFARERRAGPTLPWPSAGPGSVFAVAVRLRSRAAFAKLGSTDRSCAVAAERVATGFLPLRPGEGAAVRPCAVFADPAAGGLPEPDRPEVLAVLPPAPSSLLARAMYTV